MPNKATMQTTTAISQVLWMTIQLQQLLSFILYWLHARFLCPSNIMGCLTYPKIIPCIMLTNLGMPEMNLVVVKSYQHYVGRHKQTIECVANILDYT